MKRVTQQSNSSNDFVSIQKLFKKYSWSNSCRFFPSIVKRLFSSLSLNILFASKSFPPFFSKVMVLSLKIHIETKADIVKVKN